METSIEYQQRLQSHNTRAECKMLLYTAAEYKSGYLEREEKAYITEPERESE